MQKNAAVAFVLFLSFLSLSSTSRSQTAPSSPVKDLLAVRPTDRVFKPIDDTERVTLASAARGAWETAFNSSCA
ncbi:MAG TPA: hypothetical protein VI386_20050 [Candidatus Sulfotelmatobacter sp.]